MRAEWRDPEDMNPNRRTAHNIVGWRSFDPLRKLAARRGSPVTAEHITAADLLRQQYDLARIGLSAKREPWVYTDIANVPRDGPTRAAQMQTRAIREVQRALAIFSPVQRALVEHTVLNNGSVRSWALGCGLSCAEGMTLLIVALDRLVEHYRSEIDQRGLAA